MSYGCEEAHAVRDELQREVRELQREHARLTNELRALECDVIRRLDALERHHVRSVSADSPEPDHECG